MIAKRYTELGIPIILLKENHHPPQGLQQKIAANPIYHTDDLERLQSDIVSEIYYYAIILLFNAVSLSYNLLGRSEKKK